MRLRGGTQLATQHGDEFVAAMNIAITPLKDFQFGVVRGAVGFGDAIRGNEHAVIELRATANGGRDADAGGHAAHDAGRYAVVLENGI